jgi:hypothetical protein
MIQFHESVSILIYGQIFSNLGLIKFYKNGSILNITNVLVPPLNTTNLPIIVVQILLLSFYEKIVYLILGEKLFINRIEVIFFYHAYFIT